jgi:hypothetical protein
LRAFVAAAVVIDLSEFGNIRDAGKIFAQL